MTDQQADDLIAEANAVLSELYEAGGASCVKAVLAALVERVSRQPQEILSRETVDEPPEDLRAAGEAMAWADYDDMLGCIAMILSAHRLNGETHAHMLRWKIRQLAASRPHQQEPPKEQEALRTALRELYDLMPDVDDDYLLDGAKGEFALKAIRVPGIGAACQKARLALTRAEAAESRPPEQEQGWKQRGKPWP